MDWSLVARSDYPFEEVTMGVVSGYKSLARAEGMGYSLSWTQRWRRLGVGLHNLNYLAAGILFWNLDHQ